VQKLICIYCRKKGAFVRCGIQNCARYYHLHCGASNGALNQYQKSVSYCRQHRPLSILPPQPRPLCHLCNTPVNDDWLQCPVKSCSIGLHRHCVQERANQGEQSCPNCGEVDQFVEEMDFFGILFRNFLEDRGFIKKCEKPPSASIELLTKELGGEFSDLKRENDSVGLSSTKEKFSPITLMAAQAKGIEVINKETSEYDILSLSSESEADAESSSRDSSPAFRRKVAKQPGRSPKKRVVKMITNELLKKSRPYMKPIYLSTDVDDVNSSSSNVLSSSSSKNCVEKVEMKDPSKGKATPKMSTVGSQDKVVKVEFHSESSDGFLSDIDDVLQGNIENLDSHPMKDLVFSTKNKYLGEVLQKLNNSDEEPSPEKKEEVEVKKRGRKKKDSPRKNLLKKKTARKFTVKENEGKSEEKVSKKKGKKTNKVTFLPLSERQIYHGRNWVPMTAVKEAESECYTDWINKFSGLRIDELVDMNSSEKVLMTMWNTFLDKNCGAAGYRHMDSLTLEFLDEKVSIIINRNLIRNFLAHLTAFHQIGAVSSETIYKCIHKLQDMVRSLDASVSESQILDQFKLSWSVPPLDTSRQSSVSSSSGSSASTITSPSTSTSSPRSSNLSNLSPHSRGMQMISMSHNNSSNFLPPLKKPRLSSSTSPPLSNASNNNILVNDNHHQ